MDRAYFEELMGETFAAFQKADPKPPVLDAIFKQIDQFPDAFMDWAAEQMQDSDRLPLNIGRHMRRNLWPEWRASQISPATGGRSGDPQCPECHGEGWFHVWKVGAPAGTAPTAWACRCNRIVDSWPDLNLRRVCLAELKAMGWTFHEPPMVRTRPATPLSFSLNELLADIRAGRLEKIQPDPAREMPHAYL